MAAGEDLCVTAGARLIITRPGSNAREEQLLVGASGQGSELYPPICASPGRFAANEGIYLRQAVRELAEVLAAMVIRHLESPS